MTVIADNFLRPDGALGGSWGTVIPNNAESGPNTFAGNILINGHGFGPINAFGGDAGVLWAGGQTFGNDQWASATVKTAAASTAILSISAAVQLGGNTTYTYTVSSGSVATQISGGALDVIITGMADAGNNGNFVATTFGVGTFTVANASGVTNAGQTGTGTCPSDSGGGVMVRGSGTSPATLNGYFFHCGSNSFNGAGRTSYHELWKVVNGVGTILGFGALNSTVPSPGDILTIIASGTKITALYNGVEMYQVTDSDIASGVPGLWSWSMNGPNEYVFANWTTSSTAPGNNGTTFNTFQASDGSVLATQLSSDSLTEGTALTQVASDNFQRADGGLGANWVTSVGGLQIASHLVEATVAGARSSAYWSGGQTFNSDQYAEATVAVLNLTSVAGPMVRASNSAIHGTTLETGYILLIPKTGTSGSLIVQRAVNGGFTSILTVAGVTPNIGDVFRISSVGTTITIFQNGVSKGSVTDTQITAGMPGIFIVAGTAITNAQFSLWAAGGVGAPSIFTALPNQSWASDATLGGYSNVLDAVNAFGTAVLYENATSWPNDQYCQATASAASIGNSITGPAVRLSTSQDTGYWFGPVTVGSLCKIIKIINGVVTTIGQAPYTFSSGDVFRLEAVGTTLTAKINGAVSIVVTDSSIASGKAGLVGLSATGVITATTSGTFKTWSAGAIASTVTASAGTPQSAKINAAFGTALAVTVTDSGGLPIQGIVVTFTAPASGASGTFTGNVTSVTATTNASGIATAPTFTANANVGAYSVTTAISGVSTGSSFSLTNLPGGGSGSFGGNAFGFDFNF